GGSGLALRGEPSSEVVGALGDDADAHPGMLDAAELRALALVRTGAARNEAKGVVRAGDHVSPAAELGHPEAMDDVLGPQLEADEDEERDRADDEPQRSDRLGRRSHVFGAYGWKRRTQTMARTNDGPPSSAGRRARD